MHTDHDTAIRAALAQVRDDMRAGVIDVERTYADAGEWGANTAAGIGVWIGRRLNQRREWEALDALMRGDEGFYSPLLFPDPPDSKPFHEAPAAIDRYLAGDEPWPAKETTNAR